MKQHEFFPKYLLVVVEKGMTSDVRWFAGEKEALRAYDETARDLGYEPEEINESSCYLSVWEYAEDKYELIKD